MANKNKESTRYYSDAHEKSVCKALGAIQQPNSGAGLWKKGDVRLEEAGILVECKTCMKPKESFSIKKEWLDKNRKELKSYKVKKYYTKSVDVQDNVIQLNRVKKSIESETGYRDVDMDYILNHTNENSSKFVMTTRVTDKALTELYLTIPSTITLTKKPTVKKAVNTVIKEDKTLRMDIAQSNCKRYYVFAVGEILDVFNNPAQAIALADEKMGCVINQEFKVVWERGNKQVRASITGIKPEYASGLSSKKACTKMLLDNSGVNITIQQISNKNGSILDILNTNMKKEPINLTGCSLEQILYWISKGRAVIGMKDNHQAVLITGYDEFNITMMDPQLNRTWKEGYKDSSKFFAKAGNIFISYIE